MNFALIADISLHVKPDVWRDFLQRRAAFNSKDLYTYSMLIHEFNAVNLFLHARDSIATNGDP